jgi:MerR family transcriptional regulator, heat shock protein HspR
VKGSGQPVDTMNPSILPRDQVAENLTVSTATLLRFEGRGLVKAVHQGDIEGYGPSEIRRVWTILTFHRDLGINLAGIEVILRLRDQMAEIQVALDRLARAFHETGDEQAGPDSHG